MSISGQQTINVGLPNQSANSDSLYTAFNKSQNNFTQLFSCASPYNNFTAGNGVNITSNAVSGTVVITNTGGTVNSIGVTSNTLSITSSPVTSTGNINVESSVGFNSENLLNSAAVNVSVTASYFTTTIPSTATLSSGTPGQFKTLMMNSYSGNMVITVSQPAWTGNGLITFSSTGTGCILQYINSKWFCIGNNGAVFS